MRIVVASGKGGTGKTTIATSLALVAAEDESVRFLDCDVEAPNAGIFLQPVLNTKKEVGILIPIVDETICTYCGKCAEVCQFHAIAVIGKKTLVFPELCHGCGSCTLICPEHAISEHLDVMGVLESGPALHEIDFAQGVMNVGEPMAVPIIRELKKWEPNIATKIEVRDAPPGASCPVVETIRGADFVLLVTEPTPFGLHDLKLAIEVVEHLNIPFGVIINRDGIGDKKVEDYCQNKNIPILLKIPEKKMIAHLYSKGIAFANEVYEWHEMFGLVFNRIQEEVTK